MQSVLIVWEHGGNLGHLARLAPVVRVLLEHGHAVTVAARALTQARLLFGADVMYVNVPKYAAIAPARAVPLCPADVWLGLGFANTSGASALVVAWCELLARVNPSALIVDASPFALYAAHLCEIHTVAIGNGFEIPPDTPGLWFVPWMANGTDRSDQTTLHYKDLVKSSEARLSQAMVALGQQVGSVGPKLKATSIAELLGCVHRAVTVFPETDHFLPSLRRTNYVGPIWAELPGAKVMGWPNQPGTKVLCYLNLKDARHKYLWIALKSWGANVVVLSPLGKSEADDEARLYGVNVQTQMTQIHQLLVECDAAVGEGAVGFVSQVLAYGKPLLVLPTQLEQALLSYRLTQQALALSTISHKNQKQIATRVDQLLHDVGLKNRVAKFSQRYAGFDPKKVISEVAEMALGNKCAPLTQKSQLVEVPR